MMCLIYAFPLCFELLAGRTANSRDLPRYPAGRWGLKNTQNFPYEMEFFQHTQMDKDGMMGLDVSHVNTCQQYLSQLHVISSMNDLMCVFKFFEIFSL
jgi:hypothetical protein